MAKLPKPMSSRRLLYSVPSNTKHAFLVQAMYCKQSDVAFHTFCQYWWRLVVLFHHQRLCCGLFYLLPSHFDHVACVVSCRKCATVAVQRNVVRTNKKGGLPRLQFFVFVCGLLDKKLQYITSAWDTCMVWLLLREAGTGGGSPLIVPSSARAWWEQAQWTSEKLHCTVSRTFDDYKYLFWPSCWTL